MDSDRIADALWSKNVGPLPGGSAVRSTGWLDHYDRIAETVESFELRWHERGPRFDTTVLIGMGGSTSGAGMLAQQFGKGKLTFAESTHPDMVATYDFTNSNVIASSKSGRTLEVVALLAHALSQGLSPRDLWVITDEGTSLHELAISLGAEVTFGDSDTGGRFSALSAFGILPAIASGASTSSLLEGSSEVFTRDEYFEICRQAIDSIVVRSESLTYVLPGLPTVRGAGQWMEQLIAESTGKAGRGIIPVAQDETSTSTLSLREIHRTHLVATALACYLDVNPFDQPNVEESKTNLYAALSGRTSPFTESTTAEEFLNAISGVEHVTLQCFVPEAEINLVEKLRQQLASLAPVVTANYGPRYLHSTGQLHKGGPASIAALQICQNPLVEPFRITGRAYSFETLLKAQQESDAQTLRRLDRKVHTLRVDSISEVVAMLGI